jgi:hypothetical protein
MLSGELCKQSAPRIELDQRAREPPGARADRTTAYAACRSDDPGSGESSIVLALAYTA